LLLLALAALGGWHARAAAAPDGAPNVNGIQIDGAPHLDTGALKRGLATTEPQPWEAVWPLRQPHPFDLNDWRTDLDRIQGFCWAAGYYQCRVLFDEVTYDGDDGVRLTALLQEGEPTTVSAVRGLEALPPDVREVMALRDLPLRPGQVFRQADWVKEKQQLQDALYNQGYSQARVEGRVEVRAGSHRADATLFITPGRRFQFGQVHITDEPANKGDPLHVPSRRIAEQVQAVIHPGDWFSPGALEEARLRLFKMGVFTDARVVPGEPDETTGTIPVKVEVQESLLHTQSVGLGFGVDLSHNEAHLSVEHADRNFMGDLRSLYLRAKAGYAFIPGLLATLAPADARPQTTRSGWTLDAEAKLEQPRFLSPEVTAQLGLGFKQDLQQAFEYSEGRVKLGAIWPPFPGLSIFPSYNLELFRLSGLLAGADSIGSQGPGCVPDAGDAPGACDVLLSYAELDVEYDGRDDRLQPRNGFFAALSVQGAGGPLGGHFDYLRFQPEARYYRTFDFLPRLTLAAKLKLGTLVKLGRTTESPIVARFYSGGANSMRGFGAQRLSPMLLVSPGSAGTGQEPPETIPIGGDGQLEASIEARYRVTGTSLFGAIFLDMGFVTLGPFDFTNPGYVTGNMMYAVGIGVRHRTPVGPIRLDLARRLEIGGPLPIVSGPAPERPDTCFGLLPTHNSSSAGAPEGLCAFHLSIGEAF